MRWVWRNALGVTSSARKFKLTVVRDETNKHTRRLPLALPTLFSSNITGFYSSRIVTGSCCINHRSPDFWLSFTPFATQVRHKWLIGQMNFRSLCGSTSSSAAQNAFEPTKISFSRRFSFAFSLGGGGRRKSGSIISGIWYFVRRNLKFQLQFAIALTRLANGDYKIYCEFFARAVFVSFLVWRGWGRLANGVKKSKKVASFRDMRGGRLWQWH